MMLKPYNDIFAQGIISIIAVFNVYRYGYQHYAVY